jgi:hypothetical protein
MAAAMTMPIIAMAVTAAAPVAHGVPSVADVTVPVIAAHPLTINRGAARTATMRVLALMQMTVPMRVTGFRRSGSENKKTGAHGQQSEDLFHEKKQFEWGLPGGQRCNSETARLSLYSSNPRLIRL